jgi:hypothetical protein
LMVSASPTCRRKTSSACSTVLMTRTFLPTPGNYRRGLPANRAKTAPAELSAESSANERISRRCGRALERSDRRQRSQPREAAPLRALRAVPRCLVVEGEPHCPAALVLRGDAAKDPTSENPLRKESREAGRRQQNLPASRPLPATFPGVPAADSVLAWRGTR